MPNERAILGLGVPGGNLPAGGDNPLELRLWGPNDNVHLHIDDLCSALVHDVPPHFLDLIDIATYVYVADQATTRGGAGVENAGAEWRRTFFFRIPVRTPEFWKSPQVMEPLRDTLSFLSEDEYIFDFHPMTIPPPFQHYFNFTGDESAIGNREEVMLFSGGLDSLGGAIEEAVTNKRRIALVTHLPTNKFARRRRKLQQLLAQHAGVAAPVHFPVCINEKERLNSEYTQRSRSFLYAALGATVANILGLSRIRFYENGIVSLNFHLSDQVVGAKATRTTHPRVLNGFKKVLSAVAERPFDVQNPFLWKTKTEIVRQIASADCAEMIGLSTSCAHISELSNEKTHCGACSQCIDRRFAVLSAAQEAHDPADAYKVDLLTGARAEGEPRTMLASYVETASQIRKMSALDFYGYYGEVGRVVTQLPGANKDRIALDIFDLHKRHATQVSSAVTAALAKYSTAILERRLPDSCLLRLVCDSYGSTLPSIPAATEVNTTTPDNYCRKKGECWAIRFNGNEEKIYMPEIGFYHLQMLLEDPGTTFSAAELDCAVSRKTKGNIRVSVSAGEEPVEDGVSVLGQSNAGPQLDAKAIQSYRLRIREIEGDLEKARKNNDLGQIAKLEKEKNWLSTELTSACGPGGRVRKLADERNKVRNRVCNAIQRTIKKIKQYDELLSEHLGRPTLSLGHSISYMPRSALSWSTIPAAVT